MIRLIFLMITMMMMNLGQVSMTTTSSPFHIFEIPFIANGSEANLGDLPFILSLKEEDTGHFCGGVLIEKSIALTAAHCLDRIDPADYTKIEVIGGEFDLHNFENHEQKFLIREVMIHPDYVAQDSLSEPPPQNDLAALLLDGVRIGRYVQTIKPATWRLGNVTGRIARLGGWGISGYDKDGKKVKGSRVLQTITLPIISDAECRQFYPNSLQKGMICAGPFKGRATCQGDSGGPMVLKGGNGTRQLVGITSWGSSGECGQQPGVYVKISHFHRWIQCASLMRRKGGFTNRPLALNKMFKKFGKCPCQGFVCPGDLTCVSKEGRCDGKNDCGDLSDESHCPKCGPEAFHCSKEARCIPKRERCDCIQNCLGGEDEVGCEGRENLPAGKFRCSNGQCIPASWKCDDRPGCLDGSDEVNCPTKPTHGTQPPIVSRPFTSFREPIRVPSTTPYITLLVRPTLTSFFGTGIQNGGLPLSNPSSGIFCTLPPNTTCPYCQSLFCLCLQTCALSMRACGQCAPNHKTCVSTHCGQKKDKDIRRF